MPPKRGMSQPLASKPLASKPTDASLSIDDMLVLEQFEPRVQIGPNHEDTNYVSQLELCRRSLSVFPSQACVCPEVPREEGGPPRESRFYTFYHDNNWLPGDPSLIDPASVAVDSEKRNSGRAEHRLGWSRALDEQSVRLLQVACIPVALGDLVPPDVDPPALERLFPGDPAAGTPGAAGSGKKVKYSNERLRIVFALPAHLDEQPLGADGSRLALKRLEVGGGARKPRLEGSRAHDHLVRLNRKAIALHQSHKIQALNSMYAAGLGAAPGKVAIDRPIWSAKQMSKWEGKWPMLPDRNARGPPPAAAASSAPVESAGGCGPSLHAMMAPTVQPPQQRLLASGPKPGVSKSGVLLAPVATRPAALPVPRAPQPPVAGRALAPETAIQRLLETVKQQGASGGAMGEARPAGGAGSMPGGAVPSVQVAAPLAEEHAVPPPVLARPAVVGKVPSLPPVAGRTPIVLAAAGRGAKRKSEMLEDPDLD